MSSDLRNAWAMLRAESPAWAIEPGRLNGIAAFLARGERIAVSSRGGAAAPSGVAVIPIVGPLARNGGLLADYFGFSSYSSIRQALAQAVSNSSVERILLYVDSPGGAAMGCEETAAEIAAATKIKPVVSFVDGLAASAGYWLASQAPQIVLTPSGEVGSIGVLLLHIEVSRGLEMAGIKPTFIVSRASPYKVESNSFEPLSTDAKGALQSDVDQIAEKFIAAVSRGRRISSSKVRADFGKGRTLMADAARTAGMVDRIGTLRDVIGNASVSSAVAARRHRLEMDGMTPQQRHAEALRLRLAIEAAT